MWLWMHRIKIRYTAMDHYGQSNWVTLCFLAWTFWMCSRKQYWSLDLEQKYPNSFRILLYFVLFNPTQEDCIAVDAKCQAFLWISQQTLVSISRVLKTLLLVAHVENSMTMQKPVKQAKKEKMVEEKEKIIEDLVFQKKILNHSMLSNVS